MAAPPSLRRAIVAASGALALFWLGMAGTVLAFPVAGAITCPTCYGLERLDDNTFTERPLTDELRRGIAEVLAESRRRVSTFYGGLSADPRILVCVTEACYRRIGGGEARGTSLLDIALRLSPRGIDPVIASHEGSHIELHQRVGRIHFLMGAIPAWFDEGVAVVVSDDPRYLAPDGIADRCLAWSDEPLPSGASEWGRQAGVDNELYAKAACRVAQWISARSGPVAVTRLLARVSAGTSFATAYADQD